MTATGYGPLLELLESTRISDLPTLKNQEVIEFGKDDLIRDVNDALNQKKILSAPVYDHEGQKYLGMVDLRDIVAFVLSLHSTGGPVIFTVEKLVDFSGMNPFISIESSGTALQVLKEMCQLRVHRMPLISNQRVVNVASQTDILAFVVQNKEKLGPHGDVTIGELQKVIGGIGGQKQLLLSIQEDESVGKAFTLMKDCNVHGVPVLNKEGKLVGNISVFDMQYVMNYEIQGLNATATEFFQYLGHPIPLVKCTTSSKFVEVLEQLAAKKVHRTYVVDAEDKPVDIITLTNILDALVYIATGFQQE